MTHRRGAKPCHRVCRGHGPSPALPPSRGEPGGCLRAHVGRGSCRGAELGCNTGLLSSRHTKPLCRSREKRHAEPATTRARGTTALSSQTGKHGSQGARKWALLASPMGARRGGVRALLSVTPQERRPL